MTTCADIDVVAPDLALGMLSGAERAEALAHLDTCQRCRDMVEQLSETVDVLGSLAPPAEPPPGFEARVLAHIDEVRPRSSRRRRVVMMGSIAAALVLGALLVVGALSFRSSGSSTERVASYTMRTPEGRDVGEAYMHEGDSTWVFVDVPGWSDLQQEAPAPGMYALRVTADDGQVTTIPSDFQHGSGGWGTNLGVEADHVRELALVDRAG